MSDRFKSSWPEVRRGLQIVNNLLPGVAVLLGIVGLLVLGSILSTQHTANLEFCSRSNDARVSSVENLRGDVRTLKAQLALWEAALSSTPAAARAKTPPPVLHAYTANITALRHGIAHKQGAVRQSIRAQSSVAIRPGSPVVNCQRAYP